MLMFTQLFIDFELRFGDLGVEKKNNNNNKRRV